VVFQFAHRSVAVVVGEAVQVGSGGQLGELLSHGLGPHAGQEPLAVPHRGSALFRYVGHRPIIAAPCHSSMRVPITTVRVDRQVEVRGQGLAALWARPMNSRFLATSGRLGVRDLARC